jgi:hypothetical protein
MSEIKRDELYERIWSKAMSKVAAEYGLSDVGLAKVCERLEVPRPPRGYWARVAHGHVVERPPLLPLGPSASVAKPRVRATTKNPAPVRAPVAPQLPPVLPPSGRDAHPAVAALMEQIIDDPYNRDTMLTVRCRGQATLRVSEAHKGRALVTLNSLCRALEAAGIRVTLEPQRQEFHRYELLASDRRGSLRISLIEKTMQVAHVLTERERENQKRHPSLFHPPRYDRRPTGLLTLELLSGRYWSAVARWTESTTRRLDGVVAEVVARVHELFEQEVRNQAAQAVARQAEAERARLRALDEADRERIRAREEAERQHQAALTQDLRQMALGWKESEIIREFLERAASALSELDDGQRERRMEWLAWARRRADEMDPLRDPASIAKVLAAE